MGKKSRRSRSADAGGQRRAASVAAKLATDSHSERYPALNGLRGLAALGVFAVHAYGLARFPQLVPDHATLSFVLAWPLRIGWSGVNVFFVLSAFLLSLPFVQAGFAGRAAPRISAYAARRVLRIVPAYLVQLLVLFGLIALGWAVGVVPPPYSMARMLVQPVFLYDIGWPGILTAQKAFVASWWTLPVELSFYALLPWLTRWLRPGRWPWLLIGIAFAWCWRAWLLWTQPHVATTLMLVQHLPGCLDQFVIGMLAAYAFARGSAWLRSLPDWRMEMALVVAAAMFVLLPAIGYLAFGSMLDANPHPQPLLIGANAYLCVAAAVLVIVCARGSRLADITLDTPPLRWMGRISYGFYLWHLPVLLWLRASGGVEAAGGALAFAMYGLLFSLVIAGASWRFIERPALRFAARWPTDDRAKMSALATGRSP